MLSESYLTTLVSLLYPPSYSVELSNSLKSNSFSPQMSISSSLGVNNMWTGLSLVTRSKPLWKARNCFSTLLLRRKSA